MRSAFVVLAAIAATVVAGGPAAAADLKTRKPPSPEMIAKLRLADSAAARETRVYIVQMKADPTARYQGGVAGLAKSAPEKGAKYDARSSQAQMYAARVGQQQDAALAKVGASGGKLYSYRHALNGFAARMTAAQANRLRKDKTVAHVWEDQIVRLDTNNSPRFLGLLNKKKGGLRQKHGLRGENIIIGVIDSGIVQEHPSLDDTGFPAAPAGWAGICQEGEAFPADSCNNKLIGARFYIEGFGESDVVESDFISPRDSDGHGTHTATTAGGNEDVTATLAGIPVAVISGIAPRARIAAYKACWQAPGAPSAGCAFSDTAAAADQAVADGVDIITYSIGTAFAFDDPTDISFLFADAAGVFVSRSAGNEGPGPETTAAGEPWVTSVAASTLSGTLIVQATTINSPPAVAGQYTSLESAVSKSLQETGPITNDLKAAEPIDACTPLPAGSLAGFIGLIARGTCDFVVKLANAVDAGAIAVLMYTNANPKTVMGGTADEKTLSIPAVMIDNAPGLAIQAQLEAGNAVNATLAADTFLTEKSIGNVMAAFSSRGPFPTAPDWVKPDITAPGVNILAGGTPEPNDGSFGGFFQYLSGTSMSTPHIAGLAALVREKHPDWSPAMVKSALMTTARQNVKKEDGVTWADPFDFGAGHVNPNKAIDPGLVYHEDIFGYVAGMCGAGSMPFGPEICDDLAAAGYTLDPSDVNLPSIGIGALAGPQTVRRTVTNVSDKRGRYHITVRKPAGYHVKIKPKELDLMPGETGSYELTFTNLSAPPGEWGFGRVVLRDQWEHVVASPIAIRSVAVIADDLVSGTGESGETSFDVTFGFTGAYTAGAHGMEGPFVAPFQVADDPDDSYDFLEPPQEVLVDFYEVPPGSVSATFSLFDQYSDQPNHDMDLYVYYCTDDGCALAGQSATATSNETVRIEFPVNDPAIDDFYAAIVHGFETVGGLPANSVYFNWTVAGPTGTLAVSPDALDVTGGQVETLNVSWSGLFSGPGAKIKGEISHSAGGSIQDLTTISVENDEGATYAELCALIPDEFGC